MQYLYIGGNYKVFNTRLYSHLVKRHEKYINSINVNKIIENHNNKDFSQTLTKVLGH